MRKWLFGCLAVCALLGMGASYFHAHHGVAASITVAMQDDAGGGTGLGIPAVNDFVSGDSGGSANNQHIGAYRIVANTDGKFFVLAHYRLRDAGVSKVVDCALPVFEKRPGQEEWTSLGSHNAAFAYFDGSTMNY